jgi:hypothetical protein
MTITTVNKYSLVTILNNNEFNESNQLFSNNRLIKFELEVSNLSCQLT